MSKSSFGMEYSIILINKLSLTLQGRSLTILKPTIQNKPSVLRRKETNMRGHKMSKRMKITTSSPLSTKPTGF